MGEMGACHTVCCWKYIQGEKDENNAILGTSMSSGSEQALDCISGAEQERKIWGSPRTCRSGAEQNPWSGPRTCRSGAERERNPWSGLRSPSSVTEVESDVELRAFIMMRNQADKDTEEWEKLNYDIHALKCARREVSTRWKKILLLLGYQREVDSLLAVNKQSFLTDSENGERAKELMRIMWKDSGLFPRGVGANTRYLYVMDRLVSLDSAEDFVRLAKEKYPKTEL